MLLREISEIVASLILEPTLKNIYVEGASDRNLIRWFIYHKGIHNIIIYNIDSVNIPVDLLKRYVLPEGCKKSRVIALALIMEELLSDGHAHLLCVVDTDWDMYLNKKRHSKYLLYTKYSCILAYFYLKIHLSRFLSFSMPGISFNLDEIFDSLSLCLREMFLLRLVNEDLAWKMKWVNSRKYINFSENRIRFQQPRYLNAYLSANNKLCDTNAFNLCLNKWRAILDSHDIRNTLRSDDLCELLMEITRTLKDCNEGFKDNTTLEGAYLGCCCMDEICQEDFFVSIESL